MSEPRKLVIIDGKSVFYRAYFAMPNLATPQGQPTSGVFGFAMMGLRIIKELKPDYVIVAWDKSKTNIRSRVKLYKEYKAQRKPMPEDLREQIPNLRRLFDAFGWPLLEIDDFEADDIMATLSKQGRDKNLHTVLVTSDLDILQAVHDDGVEVLALKRGLTNTVRYTPESFTEEYGMTPEQFIDYKALKGDASDNVPGVKGVGDKTARELIQAHATLDGVYKNIDKIKESHQKKLLADKEMAYLSRKLLEIRFDAPVKLDLKSAETSNCKPQKVVDIFNELGFKSLFKELPDSMRVGAEAEADVSKPTPKEATNMQLTRINETAGLKKININTQTVLYAIVEHDPSTRLPVTEEVIVSTDRKNAYLVSGLALVDFTSLVEKFEQTEIIGHDLKDEYKIWPSLRPKDVFDVDIGAYLSDPLSHQPSLPELARVKLGVEPDKESFRSPLTDESAKLIAYSLWELEKKLKAELNKLPKLKGVAYEIDFPTIPVLAKMERFGVKIDPRYFAKTAKVLTRQIDDTRDLIYKEAKQEFNISSPQQLQTILFEKLNLSTQGIKKIKTGYSTASSELDKLRGLHPIINLITEYREVTKLKNTYIDPLPKLIDKDNRLHTSFSQTVAPTGRLSSENPNLMNIPVRTEAGRAIRQAFVANTGNVLVSADYSQFELRLAAVLAGDKNMIHAFNKGIDIHTMTAAEIYDLDDIEMVTADQRRAAKTVNFGVLYGMSPHGLSEATGMNRVQAQTFIDKYFELRKDLLKYLDKLKKMAKDEGYVETMFGRRRPTPDVRSSNWMVRAGAERAAMNMPMQGTEADLMKMAMIKIDQQLDDDSRMLLQIHDSILVECPQPKSDAVAAMMKKTMESIYKLPVKLDVDVKSGLTWGDL